MLEVIGNIHTTIFRILELSGLSKDCNMLSRRCSFTVTPDVPIASLLFTSWTLGDQSCQRQTNSLSFNESKYELNSQ